MQFKKFSCSFNHLNLSLISPSAVAKNWIPSNCLTHSSHLPFDMWNIRHYNMWESAEWCCGKKRAERSFFSITHFNSHRPSCASLAHRENFDKNRSCHFKSIPRWCNFHNFNCVWFLPISKRKYSELNVARANEAKMYRAAVRTEKRVRLEIENGTPKDEINHIFLRKTCRAAVEWDHSNTVW